MIEHVTVEQIRSWPMREGWRVAPTTGERVKLGSNVIIGSNVSIDSNVSINSNVIIGNYVTIDSCVSIGSNVIIDSNVSIDHDVIIGSYSTLGSNVRIDSHVRIGSYVRIPVYRGAEFPMHWASVGHIRSGCLCKSFQWWRENVVRCAEEHKYSEGEQKLYAFFIEQIIAWETMMVAAGLLGMAKKGGE